MIDTIIGNNRTPQHLPIGSLKVFGTNPYNEAIFRVVWSESRYYLVGANHVDYDGDPSNDETVYRRQKDPNVTRQKVGYKWLPLYPGRGCWVLEMWKSAMGFTGCSPEQYEINYRDATTKLLTLGPYPSRGEYCHCFSFPIEPTYSQVYRQINLIKAGWGYSYTDKVAANKLALENKEKEKTRIFKDIFKDSQQAFNNKPSNIRPGKRTKDKINLKYSAEELRLRKQPGFGTGSPRG